MSGTTSQGSKVPVKCHRELESKMPPVRTSLRGSELGLLELGPKLCTTTRSLTVTSEELVPNKHLQLPPATTSWRDSLGHFQASEATGGPYGGSWVVISRLQVP